MLTGCLGLGDPRFLSLGCHHRFRPVDGPEDQQTRDRHKNKERHDALRHVGAPSG
jgi:hypothetical protein